MPNEYVMRQNAAIIRCSVPSFVADFVYVVAWVDSDGKEYVASENFSESKGGWEKHTKLPSQTLRFRFIRLCLFMVHFIRWHLCFSKVVNQYYDPEILGKEYIMRGNAAILRCSIPSFVADFVHVIAWIDEAGVEYASSKENASGVGKSSTELWNSRAIHTPSTFLVIIYIPLSLNSG